MLMSHKLNVLKTLAAIQPCKESGGVTRLWDVPRRLYAMRILDQMACAAARPTRLECLQEGSQGV